LAFWGDMPARVQVSEFFVGFSETRRRSGIDRQDGERHEPMGGPFVNLRPEGDFLSAEDLIAAFEGLSPDDKLKLAAIEAIKTGGTRFGRGELVHEAVCRALTGDRNCPRDVPFMAFLVETMRSISHHDRAQRRRTKTLVGEGSTDSNAGSPATGPSPEDDLMEKQEAAAVQAIHRVFDDDPEAQLILMGWQDELRGAALRDATGLDQGQIDYASKRIRTKMKKTYPNGWLT
jgi:DNA-directed RNA polymerase specialized sigma24 family protein